MKIKIKSSKTFTRPVSKLKSTVCGRRLYHLHVLLIMNNGVEYYNNLTSIPSITFASKQSVQSYFSCDMATCRNKRVADTLREKRITIRKFAVCAQP